MATVMAVCLMLVTLPPPALKLLPPAGFFLLPIAMGSKPCWQHAYNDLPPSQRPQTRRVS